MKVRIFKRKSRKLFIFRFQNGSRKRKSYLLALYVGRHGIRRNTKGDNLSDVLVRKRVAVGIGVLYRCIPSIPPKRLCCRMTVKVNCCIRAAKRFTYVKLTLSDYVFRRRNIVKRNLNIVALNLSSRS